MDEWHKLDVKEGEGRTIYCCWCGVRLVVPKDITLPKVLICHLCRNQFILVCEGKIADSSDKPR